MVELVKWWLEFIIILIAGDFSFRNWKCQALRETPKCSIYGKSCDCHVRSCDTLSLSLWRKVSGALGERDELKRQLEETTPTSATPTTSHSNDDDVVSLQETVAKLQVQLLEKETASSTTTTPTTATDVEKELEERGVSFKCRRRRWRRRIF